jgi:hypothetical protein
VARWSVLDGVGTSSLPLPVSPRMSTGASVPASFLTVQDGLQLLRDPNSLFFSRPHRGTRTRRDICWPGKGLHARPRQQRGQGEAQRQREHGDELLVPAVKQ